MKSVDELADLVSQEMKNSSFSAAASRILRRHAPRANWRIVIPQIARKLGHRGGVVSAKRRRQPSFSFKPEPSS